MSQKHNLILRYSKTERNRWLTELKGCAQQTWLSAGNHQAEIGRCTVFQQSGIRYPVPFRLSWRRL